MLQGDIPVKQYSCTTEVAAQLFAKAQWEPAQNNSINDIMSTHAAKLPQ